MMEAFSGFVEHFHFVRPYWLLAFFLIAFMNVKLHQCRIQQSSWRNVCDPLLLRALMLGPSSQDSKLPFVLLVCGWSLAIIALAGPTWSQTASTSFRTDASRVIILDLSRSMLTEDSKPNRFTRAKHKITDILNRPFSGETALIVFAYSDFVVTPLTQDVANIKALLPALSPNIMPAHGSRPQLALNRALHMLRTIKATQAQIIFISDATDAPAIAAAQAIKAAGFGFAVLGVGTEAGGRIRVSDGQWLQHNGKTVTTRLDRVSLRHLAIAGGGQYANLSTDDSDIQYLLSASASSTPVMANAAAQIWLEQSPWVLLLLLPVALCAFRRGWLGIVLLGLLPFPATTPVADAFEWSSLVLNQNQRGALALSANQSVRAAALFTSAEWRGIALFEAKRYAHAAQVFSQIDGPHVLAARYNQANALAHSGQLRQAIEVYDAVLKQAPEQVNAAYNKKLLADFLLRNPDYAAPKPAGSQLTDNTSGAADSATSDDAGEDGEQQPDAAQTGENTPTPAPEAAADESADDSADESAEATPQPSPADDTETTTTQQPDLTDQWLEHIPDDPGALLQQKFRSQAKRQKALGGDKQQPW